MSQYGCFAAILLIGASSTFAAETKFPLSGDNTKVTWVGKKTDGKHEGGFKKVDGTALVVDGDPGSLKLDVTIATESLYSDNEQLTAHLKASDFFDVKRYPKATFKSNKVAKSKDGYTITGDLTLLGKTKSVSFPAKISATEKSLMINGDLEIDRTAFGMKYGEGKIDNKVGISVAMKSETK